MAEYGEFGIEGDRAMREFTSGFRVKPGMTGLILGLLLVFAGWKPAPQAWAQTLPDNAYTRTVTITGGGVKNIKMRFHPDERGFSYHWIRFDEQLSGDYDSTSVEYCIARDSTLADTLAERPIAWRYGMDYVSGNVALRPFQNFTFSDGKWYLMQVDRDGVPYVWLDLKFTKIDLTSPGRLVITIYEVPR
jgi:hypothetical protein